MGEFEYKYMNLFIIKTIGVFSCPGNQVPFLPEKKTKNIKICVDNVIHLMLFLFQIKF